MLVAVNLQRTPASVSEVEILPYVSEGCAELRRRGFVLAAAVYCIVFLPRPALPQAGPLMALLESLKDLSRVEARV